MTALNFSFSSSTQVIPDVSSASILNTGGADLLVNGHPVEAGERFEVPIPNLARVELKIDATTNSTTAEALIVK